MIDKELARIKEETIETLGKEEIIKIFPRTMYLEGQKTRIVLKTPKTETSIQKVWIPETLAYILREWKTSQEKQKDFLGSEYQDYDLVVALANGRSCETKVIENAFNRLKWDAKLPNVVFHSLRHSSATYKLNLNHGDLKATQGDTGHAQAPMLTEIYAHILDEDRKSMRKSLKQCSTRTLTCAASGHPNHRHQSPLILLPLWTNFRNRLNCERCLSAF